MIPAASESVVGRANTPPTRPIRLAYLVTHPIQYQAPLLRLIAAQPDIDLTVFFQSDLSLRAYRDQGFGIDVKWDVPLVEGYRHAFLPAVGRRDRLGRVMPLSYGIASRLWRGRFDVLWIHGYARWFNWVAVAAARLAGIGIMVRDEATPISAVRSRFKAVAKRVGFFPALSAACDAFLAIGMLNRRYYLENGIAPARIFTVPYCVDNKYFSARAEQAAPFRDRLRTELRLEPNRPVILFASKLQPRKRPGDVIEAYKRMLALRTQHTKPYLLFVGDGELRQQLENEAPASGDVRFLGFRNQSELPALFELCDVFVLPSDLEPWGLIVNEVMSAGRAVIVSDRVGCAPDLVKNGVNGYVYPCGDANSLAGALADVLRSRERILAMGRASAEIIKDWSFAQDIDGLRAALRFVAQRRSR